MGIAEEWVKEVRKMSVADLASMASIRGTVDGPRNAGARFLKYVRDAATSSATNANLPNLDIGLINIPMQVVGQYPGGDVKLWEAFFLLGDAAGHSTTGYSMREEMRIIMGRYTQRLMAQLCAHAKLFYNSSGIADWDNPRFYAEAVH